MSPPFLLDTSALLAHYCAEAGHDIVGQMLREHTDGVFISVITWLEFHMRLQILTPNPTDRAEALDIYQQLLTDRLPVTLATANLAFEIRKVTPNRLPNSDALIAATARLKGATLIHRDPHFRAIPTVMLTQSALPEK